MPHQLKRIASNTFTRAFDPLLTGSSGLHASNPTIEAAHRARPDLILAMTTRWLVRRIPAGSDLFLTTEKSLTRTEANQWSACCSAYDVPVSLEEA